MHLTFLSSYAILLASPQAERVKLVKKSESASPPTFFLLLFGKMKCDPRVNQIIFLGGEN